MQKKRTTLSGYIRDLTRNYNTMTIRTFHFNPIMVNTLVLHDESGEAVIVDPGNCSSFEDAQLQDYVSSHQLTVKYIINTHPHIDHIAGNGWCVREFKAPLLCHQAGMPIYNKAYAYGAAFGIMADNMPAPDRFLNEGDEIRFGSQCLQVLYTPGHCDGSVSLFDAANGYVICGDLIFEGSVGRADLPTGNMKTLLEMIKNKILPLGDDVIIYPGHGNTTSIGNERVNNFYIQ